MMTGAIPAHGIPSCYKYGPWVGSRYENFTTVYSWSGAPVTVTEGGHSTHSLGIEATLHSDWTAARAFGSETIEQTTSSGGTEENVINRRIWNTMRVRQFYSSFSGGCPGGFPEHVRAALETIDQLVDRSGSGATHVYQSHCVPKPVGTWWTKEATEVTHAHGFEIDTPIGGISVKAQSGYGQDVEQFFYINKKSWICGDMPTLDSSHAVEAHERS